MSIWEQERLMRRTCMELSELALLASLGIENAVSVWVGAVL